jgi:hypothetical protein
MTGHKGIVTIGGYDYSVDAWVQDGQHFSIRGAQLGGIVPGTQNLKCSFALVDTFGSVVASNDACINVIRNLFTCVEIVAFAKDITTLKSKQSANLDVLNAEHVVYRAKYKTRFADVGEYLMFETGMSGAISIAYRNKRYVNKDINAKRANLPHITDFVNSLEQLCETPTHHIPKEMNNTWFDYVLQTKVGIDCPSLLTPIQLPFGEYWRESLADAPSNAPVFADDLDERGFCNHATLIRYQHGFSTIVPPGVTVHPFNDVCLETYGAAVWYKDGFPYRVVLYNWSLNSFARWALPKILCNAISTVHIRIVAQPAVYNLPLTDELGYRTRIDQIVEANRANFSAIP